MIFIIFTLHLPLVTDIKLMSIFVLLTTIEKIFESIITLMLIYAVFQNRKLILAWQVISPLIYLYNVAHIAYLSIVIVNLKLFLFMLCPMYLITYMLMLVNSYYDELGYIEDYLNDMQYVSRENFQINTRNGTLNAEDGSETIKLSKRI
ncbi:uncharacterized protein LOC117781580 isoform X2 [Drosophila innubila]|uniref:uncharacterized protein LOC117781580 isoform X2 n=1 Tax=Drosophila innubila TaxID=198719 RepID=UPI00148E7533|nr:uncharacterized protein LOC117781580 isoform X2 [Drosophila innubila]